MSDRLMHMLALAVGLGIGLAGCPGPLPFPLDAGASSPDRSWQIIPDTGEADTFVPQPDVQPQPDTGPQPDTAVLGGIGDRCPCQPPLLCDSSNICREPCDRTGICLATATECPANQGCAPTNKGVGACMPAVGPGEACSTTEFCPKDFACASIDSAPYRCLPVCATVGADCRSGGTCLPTESPICTVCSTL